MLKTIVPATLEFKDGVPYSAAYGDTCPYPRAMWRMTALQRATGREKLCHEEPNRCGQRPLCHVRNNARLGLVLALNRSPANAQAAMVVGRVPPVRRI
jgi:hypothetical protein